MRNCNWQGPMAQWLSRHWSRRTGGPAAELVNQPSNIGEAAGLLEGVKVLDLTHYLAGPYCTKLLSSLGAEVVKVERPGGDPMRRFGPLVSTMTLPQAEVQTRDSSDPDDGNDAGAWFLYLNTSKKSLTLDLKSDKGRDIARQLAASSDIVVENFAPGTMNKLGLGYEELRKTNPALVMTSISNYGQTGPYRDWKATEINLYAAGGLMNITGEPDMPPLKEGAPLAQLGAGQVAFAATMGALMYAEETGEGQHIDVSIAEYATNILENALMQYSYSGIEFTRVGNRGYGRAAWGIYPCQDGYVGIIAGPDTRWPAVAEIMEREELADPRFESRNGRMINADEVDALMLPWLLDHDKVDIFKAGQDRGLGFAYVATMQDILDMEQLNARDYFVELGDPDQGGFMYPGAPMKLFINGDGDPSLSPRPGRGQVGWVYRRAPSLGQHTEETLSGRLGINESEISGLRSLGALG